MAFKTDSETLVGDEEWRELRQTFVEESEDLLDSCEESLMDLTTNERKEAVLADIFRSYHTIKGSASAICCNDLSTFAHVAEDYLAALRAKPHAFSRESADVLFRVSSMMRMRLLTVSQYHSNDPSWEVDSIIVELKELTLCINHHEECKTDDRKHQVLQLKNRKFQDGDRKIEDKRKKIIESLLENAPISSEQSGEALAGKSQNCVTRSSNSLFKIEAHRVDSVMDILGEIVVIKSQINESLSTVVLEPRVRTLISQLDKAVRELHEKTLSIRMISLRSTFLKLQRAVKDVAQKLNKDIDFTVSGDDTEIDRVIAERIADPLLHICRNAVDHGIESAEKRLDSGKDKVGHISVTAYRKGENVIIEIQDDGRGIDKMAVIEKAIESGILSESVEAEKIPDREAFELLFHPGLSTAASVTDISGRGVGLDVVKTNINSANGFIEIDSKPGQGSVFRLCLPLTTAITDGIVVEVAHKPFILPLDVVKGFFDMRSTSILAVDDASKMIRIKDIHYPFVRLGDYVGIDQDRDGLIVLIEAFGKKMALQVDRVIGKTQVVIKPLGCQVGSTEGLGGAAVMGDGKVALIIDVAGLASIAERARIAHLSLDVFEQAAS